MIGTKKIGVPKKSMNILLRLHQIGLIAQNVRIHFPEAVGIGPDGYYYIDYKKLNSVVVEGIKEQQVFIEEITKQVDELEIKLR
jgi:hypothetical protein